MSISPVTNGIDPLFLCSLTMNSLFGAVLLFKYFTRLEGGLFDFFFFIVVGCFRFELFSDCVCCKYLYRVAYLFTLLMFFLMNRSF